MDYALEVCNAVLDIWKPTPDNKAVINLPTTVENAMPHVFASQVEYFNKHLLHRDSVILSLHPHNDRGSGVSDAELGILAGADRIEGYFVRQWRAYGQRGYYNRSYEYVFPREWIRDWISLI